MEESVSVFPSTRHLVAWQSVNCAKCGKGGDLAFRCDLAMSAVKSIAAEGRLPRGAAERIGYLNSGEAVRGRASPYWRCRDYEPR